MNSVLPYFRCDNSCNLPYSIIKDKKDNDVMIINDIKIPLNIKKSSLDYQISIYNNCKNDSKYISYYLIDKIYLLYEYQENRSSTFGNIEILDNGRKFHLCEFKNDCEFVYRVISNDLYVVILKCDSECFSKEIVGAYDLSEHKLINFSDYDTYCGLLYNVVNKKRCRFDAIFSIITKKINNNKSRVIDVLSFLVNDEVDESNFNNALDVSRKYIISLYPELCNINLNLSEEEIHIKNIEYGLSYFSFNPINHHISNVKYIEQAVKSKVYKGI